MKDIQKVLKQLDALALTWQAEGGDGQAARHASP
jgi:hypothetical protein